MNAFAAREKQPTTVYTQHVVINMRWFTTNTLAHIYVCMMYYFTVWVFFLAYKSFRRSLNILRLKYVTFSPLLYGIPDRQMLFHCFFLTVLHRIQTQSLLSYIPFSPRCVFFLRRTNKSSTPLTFSLRFPMFSIWFRFHSNHPEMFS